MKKAYFLEADDEIKRGDFVRPLFRLEDGWGPDSFHIEFRPIEEDMDWWIGQTLGELNSMTFKYEVIRYEFD